MAPFEAGDPQSGFYNDLREKAVEHGSPRAAAAALRSMTEDRRRANAVSVAQLGIGAWQLAATDPSWLPVVEETSRWIVESLDDEGRFAYLFAMPHTFALDPPWYSAMAQGEAGSLLVRASSALGRDDLREAAARAIRSLIDPRLGLVDAATEGPVLEEYPTDPPSHALNGWIWSLWGLYDVGLALADEPSASLRVVGEEARRAFDLGTATLAARLPRYDVRFAWSLYDLYPHRIAHVASPFYHRLHVEQLRAMALLRPEHAAFAETAERWAGGARNPLSLAFAVVRKGAFRILEPRRPVV
jgi:heparosan-N-sulfate-glucuronate 5-epimerase